MSSKKVFIPCCALQKVCVKESSRYCAIKVFINNKCPRQSGPNNQSLQFNSASFVKRHVTTELSQATLSGVETLRTSLSKQAQRWRRKGRNLEWIPTLHLGVGGQSVGVGTKHKPYGFQFGFMFTFTVAVNLIGLQLPWNHPVLKVFILDLWPRSESPEVGREGRRRRDSSLECFITWWCSWGASDMGRKLAARASAHFRSSLRQHWFEMDDW